MKKIDWIVSGLLAVGLFHLLVGMPHRGKSWFAAALAVCVATGGKFLGYFDTMQAAVILVDEDTPTMVLEQRLSRLCAYFGVSIDSIPLKYHSMTGFRLDSKVFVGALIKEITKLEQPVLVIIDSLTAVAGNWDTNKTDQAQRISLVLNIIKKTGATVLLLHHISLKGGDDIKIVLGDADFTSKAMGNTMLVANCDTAFAICKLIDPTGKTVFGVRTKERRIRLDAPERFAVELEDIDEDKVALKYRDSIPSQPSDNAKTIAILFFQSPDERFTVKGIFKDSGEVLSQADIRVALKELETEGIVVMGKTAHNMYQYRLNTEFDQMDTSYALTLRPVQE